MAEPYKTVLIVDDDPQILRLLQAMLGPQQVEVVSAPRPSDALRIAGERSIHVLISDVAMPEMDGHKLAERVWKLHPQAAILLISGERTEAPPVRGGHVRFLKKPFFPADLVSVLREMLTGQAECA
ncbi:MAG: response regulator [Candidatus Solibacter sp.]